MQWKQCLCTASVSITGCVFGGAGGSKSRDDKIVLLDLLKKEEIFIRNWIVCPAFYRDMMTSKAGQIVSADDKTVIYSRIISMCSLIDQEIDIFSGHENKYTIQQLLFECYNLFTKPTAKKNGIIHKNLLGKSIDYPVRTVISAPRIDSNTYKEQQLRFGYIGVPMHMAIAMFYPFFTDSLFDRLRIANQFVIEILDNTTHESVMKVPVKDLTSETINKIVKRYARSYENRLDIFKMYDEYGNDAIKNLRECLGGREVTITDIFYQTIFEVVKDKCCVATRYPLEDYRNISPQRIKILVTEDTMDLTNYSKQFTSYPVIDKSLKTEKIKWIESTRVNNLYLKGFGGDYDGDMITLKGLFTQEANQELGNIIDNSLNYYLSVSGGSSRVIEKELIQVFYNFTTAYE
jgi:DNA-directed RNA polymerase beta' subunit